jgi:hypothetical protein
VDHYAIGPYAQMAFWDHFVRSLLDQEPPRGWAPLTNAPKEPATA